MQSFARLHPSGRFNGGSFGGRVPCLTAPATGTYSSSTPSLGMPQQQAAAAHVAAADERDGKPQPLAEDRAEHVHIFRRGNAAEQDDVAAPVRSPRRKAERAALERTPVARVVDVDVLQRKGAHRRARHEVSGLRSPAFGVMTWMPATTAGVAGSGGRAKRRA